MRCSECDLVVDKGAARCPKCLRISTLVAETSPRVARKRANPGEIAVLLGLGLLLRVGAYSDARLWSWLTVGDAAVTLVVVVALAWMYFRVRKEGIESVTQNRPAPLIIGGLGIGGVAAGAFWIAVSYALDPLAQEPASGRTPSLHNWAWALLALAIALALGWTSSLLWRKLRELDRRSYTRGVGR